MSMTCYRSVVFSGYSVSFNNKTDRHDITKILVKVALNTIPHNNRRKMSNIRIIFLEMLIHMIYLSLTV